MKTQWNRFSKLGVTCVDDVNVHSEGDLYIMQSKYIEIVYIRRLTTRGMDQLVSTFTTKTNEMWISKAPYPSHAISWSWRFTTMCGGLCQTAINTEQFIMNEIPPISSKQVTPQHRKLHFLLFATSVWVLQSPLLTLTPEYAGDIGSTKGRKSSLQETGPTVYIKICVVGVERWLLMEVRLQSCNLWCN